MKTVRICILLLAAVTFVTGCAHEKPKIRPAQEIYQEAAGLAKKGKVEKAAEAFMEVRTYYPGNELAKKSLLATADMYYNNELYESALQSYEEFRVLYPTDTEADYSLYRIGLCHFNQMSTFERDQSQTVKAIQTFENFLSAYPKSPYVQGANDNMAAARTVLAKHYVYIGKFYLKKKDYKAAGNRFQYVKKEYPNASLEDDLDSLISKSCSQGVTSPNPASAHSRP
jgi:outer membrane protein assembly factor BamD